jgi:hypothetical protein
VLGVIYVKGSRASFEPDARLSVDTVDGAVVFYVWEGDRITHTFAADRQFLSHLASCAGSVALANRGRTPRIKGVRSA